MPSNLKPLGKLIRLVDEKNLDGSISRLLGINISKNFMPSVANISGVDLSKYKVIRNKNFACNIMHVGRDERLPISLYQEEQPAIVSPAYKTFEVVDPNEILPEFLMIFFHRSEFDRFTWYLCDSSIRGGLEWDRFCEIEVPVPSINEQKRYVSLYDGLMKNHKCYEDSLSDLNTICDLTIGLLKKGIKSDQFIGRYIRKIDVRNQDKSIDNVLGMNVQKTFMPSVANTSETDLSKYKVIKKGQFAYSAMQVGRDETIRVALYADDTPAIISPAYTVFEVINSEEILPEFLMMWFRMPEFNRYGWFISDSSVRASLEWERFCEINIPVPKIEAQKGIVTFYHVLETRKQINEKLKETIRPLCSVLMQGVIKDLKIKETKAA